MEGESSVNSELMNSFRQRFLEIVKNRGKQDATATQITQTETFGIQEFDVVQKWRGLIPNILVAIESKNEVELKKCEESLKTLMEQLRTRQNDVFGDISLVAFYSWMINRIVIFLDSIQTVVRYPQDTDDVLQDLRADATLFDSLN